MGFFKWLFGNKKKLNNWKRLSDKDIPNWVWNKLYNSAYDVNYYKGKTFIYKGLKLPGKNQGEYIYKVYQKLRS
jgi:hypothetical protein